MGPFGAIVVSFWAVIWFEAGIVRQFGWFSPLLALPVLISAVIAAWAVWLVRQPGGGRAMDRHARTITMQATIGEGVGIAASVNILINTGLTDYVIPSIALMVGLHFIYMAYRIPRPRFYGIAAFLLIGALIDLAVGPQGGDALLGIGTAILFWVNAGHALLGIKGLRLSRNG